MTKLSLRSLANRGVRMKPICETCNEYGDVHKVRCKSTGEIVYVCYECSAMWDENQNPLDIIVDDFFNQRNITSNFSEELEEIEENKQENSK